MATDEERGIANKAISEQKFVPSRHPYPYNEKYIPKIILDQLRPGYRVSIQSSYENKPFPAKKCNKIKGKCIKGYNQYTIYDDEGNMVPIYDENTKQFLPDIIEQTEDRAPVEFLIQPEKSPVSEKKESSADEITPEQRGISDRGLKDTSPTSSRNKKSRGRRPKGVKNVKDSSKKNPSALNKEPKVNNKGNDDNKDQIKPNWTKKDREHAATRFVPIAQNSRKWLEETLGLSQEGEESGIVTLIDLKRRLKTMNKRNRTYKMRKYKCDLKRVMYRITNKWDEFVEVLNKQGIQPSDPDLSLYDPVEMYSFLWLDVKTRVNLSQSLDSKWKPQSEIIKFLWPKKHFINMLHVTEPGFIEKYHDGLDDFRKCDY